MAKQKAATANADRIADKRPGSGWRGCKKCTKWSKGPKTPACLNCGEPFPTTPAKGKTPVKSVGGFADTIATLEEVRVWAEKMGGYDKALEAVAEMETIIRSCKGAIVADNLREAITTLANWGKKK